jgi:nucleoside-diphosphate-sugar epimerase
MRIIITGAIGHIGSYIVRDLPNYFPNSEFILIDNLLTQRFSSLYNLSNIAKYQFIEADVIKADLVKIFSGADVVIHLAAMTDAAGSFYKAEELENNNYQATLNVANACLIANVKLITLSSTSVYGTQNLIVAEDCLPEELKPQSPYATTKLKEEKLISNLSLHEGLNSIICRFGTIYGPSQGMRFHTAVNKFCWQAVMNQPITVWKTAFNQKRPYLDLNDASSAFAFIIKNNLFDGGIYNVLTQNVTVKEIVDVIKEFIPTLEISFVENEIMNQLSYEVSNQKIKNKGFEFSGNLNKGIGATINLLRNSNKLYY